jgi:hypothetical protein
MQGRIQGLQAQAFREYMAKRGIEIWCTDVDEAQPCMGVAVAQIVHLELADGAGGVIQQGQGIGRLLAHDPSFYFRKFCLKRN